MAANVWYGIVLQICNNVCKCRSIDLETRKWKMVPGGSHKSKDGKGWLITSVLWLMIVFQVVLYVRLITETIEIQYSVYLFSWNFQCYQSNITMCYPATALLRSATTCHYQRLITLEFSIFCQDWNTIYVLMSWSLLYVFFGSFHLIWHDAHRVHSPAFNAAIPLSMVFRFLMLKLEIIKVMHGSA